MDIGNIRELIDRYEEASLTVNRTLNAFVREHIRHGLTIDQFSTLRYIKKNTNCTSSELADVFCVGKSAITAIITRLVDKHYIRRVRDQKDRRVVYLSLTEEGEDIYHWVEGKINEKIGLYLNSFNESEIESFIQSYEKLATIIKKDIETEE